ncbi:DUF6615 family protein [Sedimentimonas flavescens]|uniref:DUF6615 family protein n=1 Tax=Sedimentimonas flavescens TaxID=2851012 RepID=UPI001C4A6569|nr:DUF6615 family protein [Sedimentimonas flavescens]MBW0157630.1 hypothetical protein [Sedimentimonas flavescens]
MIYRVPFFERHYLQQLAGWVWREQDDALHYGLKLQEETITEMLLLRMARECQDTGLHIKMFNRIEEGGSKKDAKSGNGADWEWYFSTPFCQVGFRVQAKVLSSGLTLKRMALSRGVYGGLKKDGIQAQDLISTAKSAGYNPIYVFYNHPWVANRELFSSLKSPFACATTDWGCAVSSATFVKNKADNRLSELIDGMMPWHLFFRMSKGCGAKEALAKFGDDQELISDSPRPEWLQFLSNPDDRGDGASHINEYLANRNLAGVAYFELDGE